MPRNQSFMLTTRQYKERTKTVTRRLGWEYLKVGEVLNGVEKCQGLKKGEKINKLGMHRVVSIRIEKLNTMLFDIEYGKQEVIKEGFPEMTPLEFVYFFCRSNKCQEDTIVTRIEFEYI